MANSELGLVLTANRAPKSGHRYDDQTGVSYEFPPRYRRSILPGRPFIYYRGREGDRGPQYFGCGLVGDVRRSENAGLLRCDILDYRPFDRIVAFKDSAGDYLEPGGGKRQHYRAGVRAIPEEAFETILRLGTDGSMEGQGQAARAVSEGDNSSRRRPRHAQYAPVDISREIEEFAIDRAVEWLQRQFAGCRTEVMPRNNPGYDLRLLNGEGVVLRFVEVKGTSAGTPSFFISEGERRFSITEGHRFILIVVWAIDLRTGESRVSTCPGPVGEPSATLLPRQFLGTLRDDTAASDLA